MPEWNSRSWNVSPELAAHGREHFTDKEFDNALRWHGSQVLATCMADWYAARVDEEEEEGQDS